MAACFPLKLLQRIAGNRAVFINYHSIKGIDSDEIINRNVYRTIDEFVEDIKYLLKNFKSLSINEIIDNIKKGNKIDNDGFYLTFDDGLSVVYNYFVPLLKKYKLTASVFLNPDFVDNKDLHFQRKKNLLKNIVNDEDLKSKDQDWKSIFSRVKIIDVEFHDAVNSIDYKKSEILNDLLFLFNIDYKEYLKKNKIYLTSDQIEEMIEDGFSFGGHSMNHPKYGELSEEEQQKQTIESINWVQNKFSLPYRIFAFPLRDQEISKNHFDKLDGKCEVSFGVNGICDDEVPFHIHRIDVESSGVKIAWVLKFEYLKFIVKRCLGKEVLKRS